MTSSFFSSGTVPQQIALRLTVRFSRSCAVEVLGAPTGVDSQPKRVVLTHHLICLLPVVGLVSLTSENQVQPLSKFF
jgi:hypothetical protein